jgi:uncharacterized membrane protein YkvA (DUF1232 family)
LDRPPPGYEIVPGVIVTRDGRVGAGTRGREDRTWVELARFLGDVGRLLWALVRDPRVSRRSKLVALSTIGYVLSPIDLIPDVVPGAGRLDDLFLVSRAVGHLARSAGYDRLRDLWSGSDDGFALLLALAGVTR